MGKIINSYIMPHPPIIVPEIGSGREMDSIGTIEAVKRVAKEIGKDNPSTIILSSPHAPCFRDYVYITDSENLSGGFDAFGCSGVKLEFRNNLELVSLITDKADLVGIKAGGLNKNDRARFHVSDAVDHGALVPLYFIQKELNDFKLVLISTPFLPMSEIYEFGKAIKAAVNASGENVVYVASGDLSHRLTADAPAGYHPNGRKYDRYLIDKLKQGDVKELINMDVEFLESAGECGTRSFVMMLGALDGNKVSTEVYSYEGPFGVGYLVGKVEIIEKEDIQREEIKAITRKNISNESNCVKLARETLETFVRGKRQVDIPRWVPSELRTKRAGVFVSLKKDGMLRGCIGTTGATRKNLAEEIMNNAISAGINDPRFPEVREDELPYLVYSVDVLGEPEKISSMEELDVKKYGVIVTSGWRRGLLLPDIEGVDTPDKQVGIALQKAGISSSEEYEMERFEVTRYR